MKRPAGVIVSGILQILGSLFVLLLSITTLVAPVMMRRSPTPPTPVPAGLFVGMAVFYGAFAILGLLTAIGLFRLKRWSRYSTLIFAGVLVAMGLCLAAVFALMPFPSPNSGSAALDESSVVRVRAVMATGALLVAALGGSWLYYFNRLSVRMAFSRPDDGGTDSQSGLLIGGRRVPLSIAIIGGFSLFGALCTLPSILWFPAALVFGFYLTGASAIPFMLLLGAVYAYTGVGLLKLWKSGRTIGILLNCYSLINALIVMMMSKDRIAQLSGQMARALAARWPSSSTTEADFQSLLPMMKFGMIAGVVASLLVLYFLVTRKSAFQTEAAA